MMKPLLPSMKLWLYLLHFVLMAYAASSSGQNLIADSSFEENTFVPVQFSAIHASKTWSRPSHGTSDLFCKCNKKDAKRSVVSVPANAMGYQMARTGNCYAGIFVHSHGAYREYLQSQLLSPLEKGKTYLFRIHISLANYSQLAVDQLGVCFLNERIILNHGNVINGLNPAYLEIDESKQKDTAIWHSLSVLYKAKGGEKVILIGGFTFNRVIKTKVKLSKDTKTYINKTAGRDAYYYIDDVSLSEFSVPETASVDSTMYIQSDSISFNAANIRFKSNDSELSESSLSELHKLVGILTKDPQLVLSIEGHTDNTGSAKSNLRLSQARAEAVVKYLTENGIDKNRLSALGYGSSRPLTSNSTAENKSLNRRVEFVFRKQ